MLLQVTQRLILHLKLLAIVTSAKDYPMLHNFQGREMKWIKKSWECILCGRLIQCLKRTKKIMRFFPKLKSKVNLFNLHVTIETIFGVRISGSRVCFFLDLPPSQTKTSAQRKPLRSGWAYIWEIGVLKNKYWPPNVRGGKIERVKFRLFCKQKRDNAGDRSDQNNQSYHETLGVVLRLQIVAWHSGSKHKTKHSKAK